MNVNDHLIWEIFFLIESAYEFMIYIESSYIGLFVSSRSRLIEQTIAEQLTVRFYLA